jgi:nucleoside-diphosphate kinase
MRILLATMIERTLSIIKPDGTGRNIIGKLIDRLESGGLAVIEMRMQRLTRPDAEGFYAIHRQKPFFKGLVEFMISGPVVLMVLEGENAVLRNRDIMGATDPKKAAPGTIRKDFSASVMVNTVHGSDGPDTAREEIGYFFPHLKG